MNRNKNLREVIKKLYQICRKAIPHKYSSKKNAVP